MEQTVVKAMSVLETLIHNEQPQRLTDLAQALGMTKPNVFRLLGTLSELGYVQQNPETSLYRPTLKVYELGAVLIGRADLVSVGGVCIRWLTEQSRESTQLAVFDDGYVVYVDKVDSPQPLKAMTAIGSRVPAGCVSTGKAMLAWLPDTALQAALPLMKKFTAQTRLTQRALEKDFAEARSCGYAVNRGEWRSGVGGIAAPIRDRFGNVVAAVGMWGAETNILGPRRDELAELTMATANKISRDLGYLSATRKAELLAAAPHNVSGAARSSGLPRAARHGRTPRADMPGQR